MGENTYEVLVVAYKTFVVEAEDEQEAIDIVFDEAVTPSDWEQDEISIDSCLETEEEIAQALRHGADDLRD